FASQPSSAAAPVRDRLNFSTSAIRCSSCFTLGLTQVVSFTVWRLAWRLTGGCISAIVRGYFHARAQNFYTRASTTGVAGDGGAVAGRGLSCRTRRKRRSLLRWVCTSYR